MDRRSGRGAGGSREVPKSVAPNAAHADDAAQPVRPAWEAELIAQLRAQIPPAFTVHSVLASIETDLMLRATRQPGSRELVLRVLLHDPPAAGAETARAEREGEIARRLAHPRIPAPLGVDRHGASAAYGLDVNAVSTLESLIDPAAPIALPRLVEILRDLLPILEHAYARGVVHGQLAPGVVLFDTSGDAHVPCFGIDTRRTGIARGDRMVEGVPAYRAPEQWQAAPVEPAADQYALALMVLELLTGRRRATGEVVHGVPTLAPVHVPANVAIRPDIPLHVNAALRRAMSKAPSHRFPTMKEFVETLAGTLNAGRHGEVLAAPDLVMYDRRVGRLQILGMAAVVIVALSVAVPSTRAGWLRGWHMLTHQVRPDLPAGRTIDRDESAGRTSGGSGDGGRVPDVLPDPPTGSGARSRGGIATNGGRAPAGGGGRSPIAVQGASSGAGAEPDAEARPDSAAAFVEVTVRGGSAVVFIDDRPGGVTPYRAQVRPGTHTVTVRSGTRTFDPVERTIAVLPGQTVAVTFSVAGAEPPP